MPTISQQLIEKLEQTQVVNVQLAPHDEHEEEASFLQVNATEARGALQGRIFCVDHCIKCREQTSLRAAAG